MIGHEKGIGTGTVVFGPGQSIGPLQEILMAGLLRSGTFFPSFNTMQSEPPPSRIRLDDFLKAQGLVGTGGEAKVRIQNGEVYVNGAVETRRRKQLFEGDIVQWMDYRLVVAFDAEQDE